MVAARGESVDPPEPLDPRVERSREQVLAATIELLAEVGFGPLAVETVAGRSGVAKSTIYRHWPGKEELVAEAFARLREEASSAPPPGPVRERTAAILRALALKSLDPNWHQAACLPALIDGGAHCPQLAEEAVRMAEERARPLVEVLQAGIDKGEISPVVDAPTLADSLVGPILLRRLFHRDPFPPDGVPGLVDQVLGAGDRSTSAGSRAAQAPPSPVEE